MVFTFNFSSEALDIRLIGVVTTRKEAGICTGGAANPTRHTHVGATLSYLSLDVLVCSSR